jgi:hypothetical protein
VTIRQMLVRANPFVGSYATETPWPTAASAPQQDQLTVVDQVPSPIKAVY